MGKSASAAKLSVNDHVDEKEVVKGGTQDSAENDKELSCSPAKDGDAPTAATRNVESHENHIEDEDKGVSQVLSGDASKPPHSDLKTPVKEVKKGGRFRALGGLDLGWVDSKIL